MTNNWIFCFNYCAGLLPFQRERTFLTDFKYFRNRLQHSFAASAPEAMTSQFFLANVMPTGKYRYAIKVL